MELPGKNSTKILRKTLQKFRLKHNDAQQTPKEGGEGQQAASAAQDA